MNKMKTADEDEKKVINYGFDALFMSDPESKDEN